MVLEVLAIREVQAQVIVVLRVQVGHNHCCHQNQKVMGYHLAAFSHVWLPFKISDSLFSHTRSWLIACDRDEL